MAATSPPFPSRFFPQTGGPRAPHMGVAHAHECPAFIVFQVLTSSGGIQEGEKGKDVCHRVSSVPFPWSLGQNHAAREREAAGAGYTGDATRYCNADGKEVSGATENGAAGKKLYETLEVTLVAVIVWTMVPVTTIAPAGCRGSWFASQARRRQDGNREREG